MCIMRFCGRGQEKNDLVVKKNMKTKAGIELVSAGTIEAMAIIAIKTAPPLPSWEPSL